MQNSSQRAMNFVDSIAGASAMLNPLRQRLLEKLREPDSASGLSRQMKIPRQKINYHLRELEKHGLIEQIEERKKGNCVERIVRATARHFVISPEALGNLATDPSQMQDRLSSTYLVAVAARTIRDLALLRTNAEKAGKKLATFTLQAEIKLASAAELNAFGEELAETVAHLAAKYHKEKAARGRVFNVIIGSYPAITKTQEAQARE